MWNLSGQNQVFAPPPTDLRLTLQEIFAWNAEHNALLPMVRWYTPETGIQERTFKEGVEAFRRVAGNVVATLGAEGSGNKQVIGILATTGQINYWTLMSGIILAGYVPFAISPRNSSQAVEYLLEATKAKYVVASPDKFHGVQDTCAKISIPCFRVDDLLSQKGSANVELPSLTSVTFEDPAMITHSSGSTAFPKPIVFTHRIVQQWADTSRHSGYDMSGQVLAVHSLPMFHGMGLYMTFLPAFCGAIAAFPAPDEAPSMPTAERVLAQGCNVKASFLFTVPSFVEAWAESADALEKLKSFKLVSFGGGPLAEHAGNMLVRNGIPLTNGYGLTEVGAITRFWGKPRSLDDGEWVYWEFLPSFTPELVPIEGMDNYYRLIVKQTDQHILAKTNMVFDDGSLAYDTNDIIARHPKRPDLWKIVGRFDDQIMHSTGEKTNPGPIEAILRKSPYVEDALMFGRSRFHAGVVISPSDKARAIPLAELVDAIWPEVEQANEFAPTHSRILREMIIMASPEKPFEYTAKRSLRRGAVTAMYEEEINTVYDVFERANRSADHQVTHASSSFEDTLRFVRETVMQNIPAKVSDSDDIFLAGGGDSLSASRIRNGLLKTQVYSSVLPSHFVFTFPTISQMAAFIYGVSLITQAVADQGKEAVPDLPDGNTTVVRFHEAPAGQVPLIMLHGGGGNIYDLWVMQAHFKTGFWAIQVTPQTPLTSLEVQTDFYFQKIKEQQPQGPYRIGGYSGSTILACRLAILFETSGDEVIQLALVDQFPTAFVHPGLALADRPTYVEQSMINLADMFRRDTLQRRQKLADEMLDAFYGRPSTELGQMLAQMFPVGAGLMLDFAQGLKAHKDEAMIDAVTRWLKIVKAPVTLYVANEGVQVSLPRTDYWKDMGIRNVYPDARVVRVEGNHFSIVENEEMIADLEQFYTQSQS